MTHRITSRWILAFDASCGECSKIASAVERACDGRLEVLPIGSADVRNWRAQALGPDAALAPTLLEISDGAPRAWIGKSIGLPLVRRLGMRSTVRVLNALGELTKRAVPVTGPQARHGISRPQFLSLGAGVGVATGIILMGRKPTFAAKEQAAAHDWVQQNKHQLPRDYDAVIAQPAAYRRQIVGHSTPEVRSALWVEQIGRYQRSQPGLTRRQVSALEATSAVAADPTTFAVGATQQPDVLRRIASAEQAVVDAFGGGDHDKMPQAVQTLLTEIAPQRGTASAGVVPDGTVRGCNCSSTSSFTHCSGACLSYHLCICGAYTPGCGFLGGYECDGVCASSDGWC